MRESLSTRVRRLSPRRRESREIGARAAAWAWRAAALALPSEGALWLCLSQALAAVRQVARARALRRAGGGRGDAHATDLDARVKLFAAAVSATPASLAGRERHKSVPLKGAPASTAQALAVAPPLPQRRGAWPSLRETLFEPFKGATPAAPAVSF